jgi:hypothetical protein
MKRNSQRRRAAYLRIHRHPKPAHVQRGTYDHAAIIVAAPESGSGEVSQTLATTPSRLRALRELQFLSWIFKGISKWKI